MVQLYSQLALASIGLHSCLEVILYSRQPRPVPQQPEQPSTGVANRALLRVSEGKFTSHPEEGKQYAEIMREVKILKTGRIPLPGSTSLLNQLFPKGP